MFRGLRRVLRDGTHPMRWLIGDEYNKLAHNAVIIDAHREAGQERRHHAATTAAPNCDSGIATK